MIRAMYERDTQKKRYLVLTQDPPRSTERDNFPSLFCDCKNVLEWVCVIPIIGRSAKGVQRIEPGSALPYTQHKSGAHLAI